MSEHTLSEVDYCYPIQTKKQEEYVKHLQELQKSYTKKAVEYILSVPRNDRGMLFYFAVNCRGNFLDAVYKENEKERKAIAKAEGK